MDTLHERYIQPKGKNSVEYPQVCDIADKFLECLKLSDVQEAIVKAHVPNGKSQAIQEAFLPYVRDLGFESEKKGLFTSYRTSGLRPDYYCPVGKTGILLEVERGKTIINNMDLLDFWKCHICLEANYLFLLVPRELGSCRHSMITFRSFCALMRANRPRQAPAVARLSPTAKNARYCAEKAENRIIECRQEPRIASEYAEHTEQAI